MANFWDGADRYVTMAMECIESFTAGITNRYRLDPNAWLNLLSGTLCENLHFLGGYGVKMHPGCFSQANVLQLRFSKQQYQVVDTQHDSIILSDRSLEVPGSVACVWHFSLATTILRGLEHES